MKKLLSLALACATVLALAAPAFAADIRAIPEEDTSLEFTTTVQAATILISVPTATGVTFNPYGMAVTVNEESVYDQIINAPMFFQNKSNVAIEASAAVTAEVAEGMTLKTSAVGASEKTKSVYVKMDYAVVDTATAPEEWDAKNIVAATAPATGGKALTKKVVGTLAAGSGDDIASEGGVLAFRLSGNAAQAPTIAWTSADTVTMAAYFAFKPILTAQES